MIRTPLAIAVGTATAVATALVAGPASAQPLVQSAVSPLVAAADGADALVASKPSFLHVSGMDTFQRHAVVSSAGVNYVPFTRTYKGLPVEGGDFVVATDAVGKVTYTSVAQTNAIGDLSVTPKISEAAALATAKKQLKSVKSVEGTKLVVVAAEGAAARLAWQSTINGTGADGVSRLSVDVDAVTGKVLGSTEHVMNVAGSGNGWIYGPVSIDTTLSGSTYLMQDPAHTTIKAQNVTGRATFSGPDNVWGNGVGTNRETG
ncbi:PepSY domain-containing protein, partial [Paractinoplanes ferrugineus]